jgi:hypothetical protein
MWDYADLRCERRAVRRRQTCTIMMNILQHYLCIVIHMLHRGCWEAPRLLLLLTNIKPNDTSTFKKFLTAVTPVLLLCSPAGTSFVIFQWLPDCWEMGIPGWRNIHVAVCRWSRNSDKPQRNMLTSLSASGALLAWSLLGFWCDGASKIYMTIWTPWWRICVTLKYKERLLIVSRKYTAGLEGRGQRRGREREGFYWSSSSVHYIPWRFGLITMVCPMLCKRLRVAQVITIGDNESRTKARPDKL